MKCIYCGHTGFSDWFVLQAHLKHHRKAPKELVLMPPEKLARIVATVEERLASFIIVPDNLKSKIEIKAAHIEDCNCTECFNKRLDALLQKSDMALQDALQQDQADTVIIAVAREEIVWQG